MVLSLLADRVITMRTNVLAVPPKISYAKLMVSGDERRIKIVRNSWVCQTLLDDVVLVFGHTIYVRDKVLVRPVLAMALQKMEEQNRVGKYRYLWTQLFM